MTQALFRQQAIDQQGERLLGDFILSQPVSYSVITGFIATITIIAVLFLLNHDYHRKQEVSGYLVPDKGLVVVSAPYDGRLVEVKVTQDSFVKQGSVLFEVQVDQTVNEEGLLFEQILQKLALQEENLKERIRLERLNLKVLSRQNTDKINNLLLKKKQLNALLDNDRNLIQIKSNALERANTLHQQGLISTQDFDTVYSAYLQQLKVVQSLKLRLGDSESTLDDLGREKETLLLLGQRDVGRIEEEIVSLQTRRIHLKADNSKQILAPVSGKVASINARIGQAVHSYQDVVSIIPTDSILQVEFYIPTRAIGFLKESQPVTIRYDAFPYQKFGVHNAHIIDVSKSIMLPDEASSSLAVNEPVYRVLASLETQSVKAFGEDIELKAGMLLSADVLLEKRTLFEWLLEPLFSINGYL